MIMWISRGNNGSDEGDDRDGGYDVGGTDMCAMVNDGDGEGGRDHQVPQWE